MVDPSIPLKRCTKCKEWFPSTPEYFQPSTRYKSGYISQCRQCRNQQKRDWYVDNQDHCIEYAGNYAREHKDTNNEKRRAKRKANPEVFKQRDKERYRIGKAVIRERQRKWRENNPDKVIAHKAQDYERNSDKYKLRAKKRRLEKPQQKYEDNKRWAALNPEKVSHSRKLWKLENPLKVHIHGQIRRARKINAEGSFSIDDIHRLYDEQEGRCFYCGITLHKRYEIEHMQPLSRGGSNWPHNLCLSCPQCNYSKGNKTVEEWYSARGW